MSGDAYHVPNAESLKKVAVDHLYHLGLDTSMDLKRMFGDTKVVCMGGAAVRMRKLAELVRDKLKIELPGKQQDDDSGKTNRFSTRNRIIQFFFFFRLHVTVGTELSPIGKVSWFAFLFRFASCFQRCFLQTDRFSLYKVGPVISVSHGMGQPSISILLHELAKLMMYAEARDFVFIRIGTSGGIGVPAGTVVVTTEGVDGHLRAQHDVVILGKIVSRPTHFDPALCQRVIEAAGDTSAVLGKTMAADDFYEGQGRLDGAICEYTDADKLAFLHRAFDLGVRNIEMESCVFAAICNKANIPALVVCCTLLDRLNGDQVDATAEQLSSFQENAIRVALNFIHAKLSTK
jgi:uridine phosphorylase